MLRGAFGLVYVLGIVFTISFLGEKMTREEIKPCKHCKEPFTAHHGNQQVCPRCVKQKHRDECRAWYRKHRGIKRGRPVGSIKRVVKLTFAFTGGKWYWRAENGLSNGPFDTLRDARQDAKQAL